MIKLMTAAEARALMKANPHILRVVEEINTEVTGKALLKKNEVRHWASLTDEEKQVLEFKLLDAWFAVEFIAHSEHNTVQRRDYEINLSWEE